MEVVPDAALSLAVNEWPQCGEPLRLKHHQPAPPAGLAVHYLAFLRGGVHSYKSWPVFGRQTDRQSRAEQTQRPPSARMIDVLNPPPLRLPPY